MRTEDDGGEIINTSANMNTSNDGVVRYERPTIDYHTLDEEILGRMERNDPNIGIAGLKIDDTVTLIESVGVDRVIGECTVLRHLKIELNRYHKSRQFSWYRELFRGLSRNRSIESLALEFFGAYCAESPDIFHNIFQILAPFFECNHNLRYIRFYGHTPLFKSLPSMMSQSNMNLQVQKVCLVLYHGPTEDEEHAKLIKSLNHIPNLSELHLGGRRLGKPG
jgi:hypothetical protein